MNPHITDTHSLVWHLIKDPSLSIRARSVLDSADRGETCIYVPSIVLVEMIYLSEKHRVGREVLRRATDMLRDPRGSYRGISLNLEVALLVESVDRQIVPDMPDRIIAATALAYKAPVLTKDSRLRAFSSIATVW